MSRIRMCPVSVEISLGRRSKTPTLLPLFVSFDNLKECSSRPFQFLEVQAQHAFIRDESSKGRWDAALTRSLFTFMLEVFERTVGRDLGPRVNKGEKIEHVC
ncbi:hypothetical protein JVU11DRAFT_5750 [Chiua virens]|nr:hypothetical protein JVU11DRAFT_5750 [Chiua virens]